MCNDENDPDVDCSIYDTKSEKEMYESLWACQEGFTSQSGVAFPSNNDISCYSLEEETVQISSVEKSQHKSLPNVDVGNHECYHVEGVNGGNPWW